MSSGHESTILARTASGAYVMSAPGKAARARVAMSLAERLKAPTL